MSSLPNAFTTTGGAGSFVLKVRDCHSFGEAMRPKLITEIVARTPMRYAARP